MAVLVSNNIRYDISDAGELTFNSDDGGANSRSWPGSKMVKVRQLTDLYGKNHVTQDYVDEARNAEVPRGGANIGPEQIGDPVEITAGISKALEVLFHEQEVDEDLIAVGNQVNIKWHYTIPSKGRKHITFNFYF